MTMALSDLPARHEACGEPLRAHVLVELAAYRDALAACRVARQRKAAALAQLVQAGVPKSWVGPVVRSWLERAAWPQVDVEAVGMSDGMMRKLLDRIA